MQDTLRPPRNFDVVAITASLGGLAALRTVLRALPPDFTAPVVVVQHRAAEGPGYAEELLSFRAGLPAGRARDGELPLPGRVYLAPPDRHVLVGAGGVLSLADGPQVNHVRPAADPLFASAAGQHGARTLAVVLTGRGEDGARGAREVRRRGGVVIVQDPSTCLSPSMPRAALLEAGADFVLPLDKIAPALVGLVMVPGAPGLFGLRRAVA